MKYKVWVARTFVFATVVEAPSRKAANRQVLDDWTVPDNDGRHMDEELWAMGRGLADGSVIPSAITIEALGVTKPSV